MDRCLHGATLEETVAPGVYHLVTGKRRDSNVYFVQSGETWVLVDTMWPGQAELIRGAAETLSGVGARPRAIVLTRVHPDHAGSASELAHTWDVTVYVHPDELPLPPAGRIIGALARIERNWMFPCRQDRWPGPVLAPTLRALGEQLNNAASAGSAGSSTGHKLTEWFLNFFDYSRRSR